MTRQYNRSSEKPTRQLLRRNMPRAEVILWSLLKSRQLLKARFRRQYSVGPCLIDFYCPECRLAIELDGSSHADLGAKEYDLRRQRFIESFGIKVLRFANQEIYRDREGVLQAIAAAIRDHPPPAPPW